MIYSYKCVPCRHIFEVIKSVKLIDEPENCDVCNKQAERYFNPGIPEISAKDFEKPEFNPGVGKVVTSKAQLKKELAELKARGIDMIEIGNEPVENLHKIADKERQAKRARRWAKLDDELGMNLSNKIR